MSETAKVDRDVGLSRKVGGASGPAAHPNRRAGDVAPYLALYFTRPWLPAHTRQRAGSTTMGAMITAASP